MPPSFDPSAISDEPRSPSPAGRGRSVSPTEPYRVETIPEDGIPSHSPTRMSPQASPRGQTSPRDQTSPRKEDNSRSDSFREQNYGEY